jgi:CSLREA domain-containing protein
LSQFAAFGRRAAAFTEGLGDSRTSDVLSGRPLKGGSRAPLVEPRIPSTATTFTVDSTVDDPIATPTSTSCTATNGKCTLRAAVSAADNLGKAVNIKLSSSDYVLDDTTAGSMVVSDPGAVTIEGVSPASTTISVMTGDHIEPFVVVDNLDHEGGVLFLSGLTIEGGTAIDGGALLLDADNGSAVVTDVHLQSNLATDLGGAIFAEDGHLWATDSIIKNNAAGDAGGGIAVADGSLVLASSTVVANTADEAGGGLLLAEASATVFDGSVSFNTAGTSSTSGEGGGIFGEDASLTLGGTTVNSNTADDGGEGGGLGLVEGTLVMQGGQLSHNSAVGAGLGGAAALGAVSASFTNVVADSNTANAGGIVAIGEEGVPATLDITGGSVSDNTSEAVFAFGSGAGSQVNLDISGARLDSNHTSLAALLPCGAAVCATGLDGGTVQLTLANDTIDRNSVQPTEELGGAVEAVASGGGSGSVDLQGDTVDEDSAPGASLSAGAVLLESVSDSSVTPHVYSPLSVTITDSNFEHDSVGTGGGGGAIGIASTGTSGDFSETSVSMSDDTFEHDTAGTSSGTADTYGGAVSISPETTGAITGSTFHDNAAKGTESAGGAVFDENESAFTFADDTFTSNTAVDAGGALVVFSELATIQQSSFSHNRSDEGGALAIVESFFSISGSTFSANVTPISHGDGGAIVADEVIGVISNSTITGNSSGGSGEGGGIWNEGPLLTLDSDTITSNVAGSGSALYTEANDQVVTVKDSIISHNRTKSRGGSENDCALSTASGEVAIAAASEGGNVLGSAGCVVELAASDKVSSNPKLRSLASNGGPTETMALEASSPARRIGLACLPTDQRGRPRPVTKCDSGAYELPKA